MFANHCPLQIHKSRCAAEGVLLPAMEVDEIKSCMRNAQEMERVGGAQQWEVLLCWVFRQLTTLPLFTPGFCEVVLVKPLHRSEPHRHPLFSLFMCPPSEAYLRSPQIDTHQRQHLSPRSRISTFNLVKRLTHSHNCIARLRKCKLLAKTNTSTPIKW